MALTPVGNDGLHPLNLGRPRRETPNVRRLEASGNIARHGYELIITTAAKIWRNRGLLRWRSGTYEQSGDDVEAPILHVIGHRTEPWNLGTTTEYGVTVNGRMYIDEFFHLQLERMIYYTDQLNNLRVIILVSRYLYYRPALRRSLTLPLSKSKGRIRCQIYS